MTIDADKVIDRLQAIIGAQAVEIQKQSVLIEQLQERVPPETVAVSNSKPPRDIKAVP